MKARYYTHILLLLLFTVFLGMGELGSEVTPGQIPTPEKNFKAELIDIDGIVTQANMVSFNGRVVVSGSRGSSFVTIPFEKISTLEVERVEDNYAETKIVLKSGGEVNLKIRKDIKCYGMTEFGTFFIYTGKVKSVSFLSVETIEPKSSNSQK